jgi:putative transposase
MSKEAPLINGHYYHIYNRGNNGENLFREERNYRYFLELYTRYIYPVADTYAYCLMKNHFHLLVRINPKSDLPGFENLEGLNPSREPNLPGLQDLEGFIPRNYSQSFSNLFNAYTKAINKVYGRSGSLFKKNFNRILIDTDRSFVHLISYIHRNPQKQGFTDDFRAYPYSSYQTIRQQKPSRIEYQQVLQWFGSMQSFENYHQQFDESQIQHLIDEDNFTGPF